MSVPKAGPLTRDELFAVMRGALDKGYLDPMVAAGEGHGLEALTQMLEVMARVSAAVDRTTQAMFILPWSGQTNPPAAGARKAIVTLTFARTKLLEKPLVLGEGLVFYGEATTDWGVDGPVEVLTGRRYTLLRDLVFNPGDMGPFDAQCEAELVGDGFNNPLPNTITDVSQPGSDFNNDLASVTLVGPNAFATSAARARAFVVTPNEPDTFVPDHVGQYVLFTSGANRSRVGRVVGFKGPDFGVDPPIGSTAELEWEASVEASVFAGTFQPGEVVDFATARGTVLGERLAGTKKRVTFRLDYANSALDPAVGVTGMGASSGASMVIESSLFPQAFAAEAPVGGVGGAAWRMLRWVDDWGLTVTNALSPSGGVHGWLDELGDERMVARAPGESDDSYRKRVATPADVVSPNAIKRALSRSAGPYPWCFREVGTSALRGLFFDGSGAPPGGDNNTSLDAAARDDAYDEWVVLFTGSLTSGTFQDAGGFSVAERVVLEDSSNNLSTSGRYGGIVSGRFVLVRESTGLLPTSVTGLRLRGLSSGAIFTPTSISTPSSAIDRRFRVWLNYADFRGFFLVGVPRLGLGEFGFAYDSGQADAYDAEPYAAFYDGFPYLNAQVYSRIFSAVENVREGGVGWTEYLEEFGCP